MELITFFLCFIIFLFMVTRLFRKTTKKLPPGPTPFPIIGNIHQLNGPLPHRTMADLAKKYGPLMHLQLGQVSTLVVSSAEAAKPFLNDHDTIFANRPFLLSTFILNYKQQDIAFSPYGSYWRQMRKIATVELLSARRVQSFRSIREEEVHNLIKSIAAQNGSVFNFSKTLPLVTYSFIAQAAFGKRSEFHEEFIALMEEVIQLMGGFSLVDLYPNVKILETITGARNKLEKMRVRVDAILQSILDHHRNKRSAEEPTKQDGTEEMDLVDVLLNVQKSGEFGDPLTDDNLKGVIYDIFTAGGETSSTTLLWAMLEMIKNPEVFQKAQAEVRKVFDGQGNADESKLHELKYMEAVIKETLRLHPAAPLLLPRESSEQCEIDGYVIPAKTRVVVNAFAIARDPKYWDEPERFNPERFMDSDIDFKGKNLFYIPFGAGRRICPGISFALPNMELPLAQLLYHFDWKLPGQMKPEDVDMTEIFGLTVGPKNDLCLIPTTHHLSTFYQK
ncbi:OLC1v1009545C1 [Oldenlandia corymbosa var. corymbosa]|uniref:OLC1v1009545C1 n=1 Tax=Oldenlandia corymbosa var. corymbosa TaxID=529605 RepID=A0AAV1DP80_OLDCO|nr:OLC1v1009545C1 [Oldenlandia corymbosa var. corymbosa]